jgi:hypothetical protein
VEYRSMWRQKNFAPAFRTTATSGEVANERRAGMTL